MTLAQFLTTSLGAGLVMFALQQLHAAMKSNKQGAARLRTLLID
jgi:hypothetical protein